MRAEGPLACFKTQRKWAFPFNSAEFSRIIYTLNEGQKHQKQ